MSHVTAMLDAYPKDLGNIDRQKLADCIHACFACGETCTACADACLSEDMVAELTKCIRTNLDCADICTTTGAVLSRHTGYDANITRAIWRLAVSPAQAAPQNAKPTQTCMNTAASAPKPAAVASRPAPTCWAVLAARRRSRQCGRRLGGAIANLAGLRTASARTSA